MTSSLDAISWEIGLHGVLRPFHRLQENASFMGKLPATKLVADFPLKRLRVQFRIAQRRVNLLSKETH